MLSAGLSAYGSLEKGFGQAAGDKYQAQILERNAQIGYTAANQTGAQLTERLNQTLGNIDAVRAAAHDDPTSPTGAAIRNTAEDLGVQQKTISVDNILQQSAQDEYGAQYEIHAANYAITGGEIGAAASLAKAFSGGGIPS